jgi:enoyl-CoA hydratase
MATSFTDVQPLLYQEEGDLVTLTLNRPASLNSISIQLSDELEAAVERVRASSRVKYLVITGANNTFCSGDDLKEMPGWGDANQCMKRVRYYQHMSSQLEELDKITIAAVDGYATGGGLELTMACDFVIATERARWGMPEVDWGITPGWGGTTRLSRYIGKRRAKEINFLGALQTAQRAVDLDLWNRVVPNDQLEAETQRLLDVLRTKNQQGLRQLKFIINNGAEGDLHTALGFEALGWGMTAAVNGWWQIEDADQGAGLRAFAEKNELQHQRRSLARDFWVD